MNTKQLQMYANLIYHQAEVQASQARVMHMFYVNFACVMQNRPVEFAPEAFHWEDSRMQKTMMEAKKCAQMLLDMN